MELYECEISQQLNYSMLVSIYVYVVMGRYMYIHRDGYFSFKQLLVTPTYFLNYHDLSGVEIIVICYNLYDKVTTTSPIIAVESHHWKVNIGIGDGLVPTSNRTAVNPDLCAHMVSLGNNEWICSKWYIARSGIKCANVSLQNKKTIPNVKVDILLI